MTNPTCLSVNAANATVGNHACVVTFAAAVAISPTLTIALTAISPTATTLMVAPTTMNFGTYVIGGTLPAPQLFQVSSNSIRATVYTNGLAPIAAL